MTASEIILTGPQSHIDRITELLAAAGVAVEVEGRVLGVYKAAVAPCGTKSGYQRHRRNSEPACASCKAACAAYMRNWVNRKKEAA